MNEEREDTELAELLKQLPAPARLDDARRAAIFAALPQGRAPRKTSYSWSRFLRVAALLVLVGGVLWGLLFPAGDLMPIRSRKVNVPRMSSMGIADENADFSDSEALDTVVDGPSATPTDALKSLEDARTDSGAQNGALMFDAVSGLAMAPAPAATPAPAAVTAPAAAAPAKPAASDVSGSRTELPQEKKRGGEMLGITGGAKPSRRAVADRERRNAPQVQQPQSGEVVELPRQEARQETEAFADATLGDIRLKAVSAGESLARAEGGKMAEAVAGKDSADDGKQNFAKAGAEWAEAPADVSVATASAQPVLSSEGRAGVAQDAAEMKGDLAAGETFSIEPVGNEPGGGGRIRYARSSSGGVAEKPADAAMKAEAQLQPTSGGSTMAAQELAKAVDSDEDVYYTEGTVYKAKRKGSGERLRSEQRASEVAAQVGFDAPEESLPSVGDARDSAADPFGGSLSAGKAEVDDSEASAEDWEGFFSELGVEWPKNPDGSPVTLGVGLREAEAKPQSAAVTEPEAVAEYQGRAATHRQERDGLQHDSISELATLERSRRKLFDDHARNMLAEGQAALRDRKPAVALEKFAAAKKFLVANEENREAIEQVHAGMREAYDFLPRGAGAAVSDTLSQSELSTMPPADKASGEPEDDLVKRMKEITIPFIHFRQAKVSDIVQFLAGAAHEYDDASTPAEQREVNIVFKSFASDFARDKLDRTDSSSEPLPSQSVADSLPPITLKCKSVTLMDALDMVAEQADLVYRVDGNTITFCDRAVPTGSLVTQMFQEIPPDLLPESAKENSNVIPDRDTDASKAAKAFFGELGVEWPQGSTCHYSARIGCLIVSTTPENLNVLEKTLAKLKEDAAPKKPVDFGPFTLIPTAEHPLSTFGLDVDSAGYSRAVSLIDEGARPEASAIRQEEFINAFDYGDLAPAEATFRVYLEGAASPFRPGNHLLRVGVKGRRLGREEQRPLRLTILLDASGSMETPERMALAKRAIEALLATLSPGDTVTLLTCSDKTRRIFSRSGWGTDEAAREAETALGGIRCQGATNLEDGIVRAFESASADFAPEAENRVVILSDGIANLGSANAEEILAKVAANRDRGISCSVIGVGRSTYNDALLEAMANRGNGQYRFLDSEASIHESFVEDLQNSFNTIAADVKIQVEWNLDAVKAYRSHGYDSRALKDEQFRDDSVDAGEVGSGQGVTVVYEMQLAEGLKPAATLGIVRIRYRRVDTGAVEEIEAPIAAEAVQRDFVRARPQFRLACAVAEFATALKHVPPAAQANALQPVAAEAVRVAAELDYYAPARGFADAVLKLMTLGL